MKIIKWYIKLWANVFKYAPKKLKFWHTIFWVLVGTSTLRVACIQTIAVLVFNMPFHSLIITGYRKFDAVIQFSCTLLPSILIDYFIIFYKSRYLNYVEIVRQDDVDTKKRNVYKFAIYLVLIPIILTFLPIIILIINQNR